jgi:hypothetical protein
MKKVVGIPFGLQAESLKHVSEVPRGKACSCVCPSCGSPLIAKQGKVMAHHFAHAGGSDCSTGYETALHLAAKEILKEYPEITLPVVEIVFDNHNRMPITGERTFKLDNVRLEKRLEGMVPDVIAEVGEHKLLIEIRVTHEVDEEKLRKIRDQGVSAIEIDLSDIPRDINLESLKPKIIEDTTLKAWLYNQYADARKTQMLRSAPVIQTVSRGFATHTDNCPIKARTWKGKHYANFIDDCLYCDFNIGSNDTADSITCAAFNAELRSKIEALVAKYKPKKKLLNWADHKEKSNEF